MHDSNGTFVCGTRVATDGFAVLIAQEAANNPTTTKEENQLMEENDLVAHARHELALLGNDEDFNNCIINAVEAFTRYGHSGWSGIKAIEILNALWRWKPLTPLTNDPEEWEYHDETVWGAKGGIWQNRRDPEAFSIDSGKTYYLTSNPDEVLATSTGRHPGQPGWKPAGD